MAAACLQGEGLLPEERQQPVGQVDLQLGHMVQPSFRQGLRDHICLPGSSYGNQLLHWHLQPAVKK